jgi:hypothetical protein
MNIGIATTIGSCYLIFKDLGLHRALRLRGATGDHSVSELVNPAIRKHLLEDLAAFEERIADSAQSTTAIDR